MLAKNHGTKFSILNPEIPPEALDKKFCRLDIVMTVSGMKVNLEVQVDGDDNYIDRVMFYWSRMFSSALPKRENYKNLPKTISISIIDFALFDCEAVHSEFALLEVNRHEKLSDKQVYHFFELTKLPILNALDYTNEKDLWLALFNAKTEEELEELTTCGGEIMGQAVALYRDITVTEEFKERARLRERTINDEANALATARRQERAHWKGVVAEQAATIAEKDATLAEQEATLLAQATLIKELMNQINNP